MNISKLTVCH